MAVFHHKPMRLRSLCKVLAAGLCTGLLGCSLFLGLDALRVTDWRPHEARLDAASVDEIWVEFSAEVDEARAEQAFSLSENGSSIPGSFTWSGKRLLFAPARPVGAGNDYEIAVLSSAETRDGNSLAKDFRFAFSTKEETGQPTIVSFQPSDGSMVSIPRAPVVINFSEPVDHASFMAAFSVSPDPGGTITFNASGSVATFAPLAVWMPGTGYRVVISDLLKDLSGNRLPAAVTFGFTAGAETGRPYLLSVRPTLSGIPQAIALTAQDPNGQTLQINSGFEANWGIELQFSEPVLRDNIESFIDFEPAWGSQIDPSGTPRANYLLSPKELFVWGSFYCLTVRKGVMDISGNASSVDTRFMIKADGLSTRPPSVELVRFRTNPGDPNPTYDAYTASSSFSNLNLSNFTPGVDAVSCFDIYLRLADGAAVDPFSLMHTFSVAATNGAALITPIAVATQAFTDPQPVPVSGLAPARISVNITNTANSGVVTLAVSNGLTDSKGNKAVAAFSLPLLK